MSKKKINNNLEWYDNGFVVTDLIIGLMFLIIILSQSFAININVSTLDIFKNVLNHNSIYLLMLIYFISLKIKFGKKYFDYLNIFVIFIYFIATVTSLLTVFQAFELSTLLELALNALLFCYLFHTFLRSTRLWKEFKLNKSPFNELDNDWYLFAITIISISLFVVGLISITSGHGAILLFLDCVFNILFARYIFLYRDYLDSRVKSIKSTSLKKSDVSEKIEDITEKLVSTTKDMKDKVEDFVEEKKIDEKFDEVKDKIIEASKDVKEKVEDFVEENKIDEKIEDVKDKVVETGKEIKDKVDNFTEDANKAINKEISKRKKKVKNYVKENKKSYKSKKQNKSKPVKKVVKGDK